MPADRLSSATTETEPPPNDGTARDALREPAFRRIYVASFISNTGRWMQTAALGVLAWDISHSSAYLGFVIFAQLGPLALLSLVGGSLADTADRRKLLLATQAWQMIWTFVLAALVIDGEISKTMLLVLVFIIGLGQGIFAPTFTSVLPTLAGRNNLSAAIALNSMQTNGARVVGPAIGGFMTSLFGFAEVFAINAATYAFVIGALAITVVPASTASMRSLGDRLFGGFKIAHRAPQVGRPLVLMCAFALLCLPFIGQLPAIAELNLGLDLDLTDDKRSYGWFYALFGMGALAGSILVTTVLLKLPRPLVVRAALVGFGLSLAWLTTIDELSTAYPAIFLVGLCYFVLPTTLSTEWQNHVDETVRGRIAALWVLSFGGTVPIANVIAGPIVDATSLNAVLRFGALAAVMLALAFRLRPGPIVGETLLD